MPFVKKDHRRDPDLNIPGDRCFREYQYFMDEWVNAKRWTTADRLAERFYPDPHERAAFLAFLVFFNLHVMKYEHKKRKENGDVKGRKNHGRH